MSKQEAIRGVSHLTPETPGGEETPGATQPLLPHLGELLDLPALEAPSLDGLSVEVIARSAPTPGRADLAPASEAESSSAFQGKKP